MAKKEEKQEGVEAAKEKRCLEKLDKFVNELIAEEGVMIMGVVDRYYLDRVATEVGRVMLVPAPEEAIAQAKATQEPKGGLADKKDLVI